MGNQPPGKNIQPGISNSFRQFSRALSIWLFLLHGELELVTEHDPVAIAGCVLPFKSWREGEKKWVAPSTWFTCESSGWNLSTKGFIQRSLEPLKRLWVTTVRSWAKESARALRTAGSYFWQAPVLLLPLTLFSPLLSPLLPARQYIHKLTQRNRLQPH